MRNVNDLQNERERLIDKLNKHKNGPEKVEVDIICRINNQFSNCAMRIINKE